MPTVKKQTELFVGLFIFTGLALLGGLVLQFARFSDHLRGHYRLTIVFDDASGVIKGSEIRMGGARIGEVASLPELNAAVQVEVALSITSGIDIPAGSTFRINSATLLGDKLIVVVPPDDKTGGFIPPDSRLAGAGPTGLDAIQNNAEIVSRDVVRILTETEATLAKVDSAVDDIKAASKRLNESLAKVNDSLLAENNLTNFSTTLENLTATTGKWKETSEKLDPTLKEARAAIQEIRNAAAGTQKTLTTAEQTLAEMKPTIRKLPNTIEEFTRTTGKASNALDRMERGEGLLGALASDNDVALDAKAFMRNLRQYGIFRYRDSMAKQPADPFKEKAPPHFGGRNR
jgi:phospholipid/cholesterol/gamma-HCH transport system substrate-binding protein